MRTLNLVLALTTLLAATVTATAGACPDSAPRASAQEMSAVEGSYQLDNGQRAKVLILDNRLYIDIDRHRQELVPVAPNRFATRDNAVTVQFDPDAFDQQIRIGYLRGAPQAIPVVLASSRHARGNTVY